MVFKNSEEFKKKENEKILKLTSFRNHVYVSGNSTSKESALVVFCKTHKQQFTTTFTNYKRSQTGLPCCGNQKKSEKLKERVFSKKTLQHMKESAFSRKSTSHVIGNQWRRTKEYRIWEKTVKKQWKYECALTGYIPTKNKKDSLVIHHFYSFNTDFSSFFLESLRFLPENGILICQSYQKVFHDMYGYKNNTIFQFLDFLKFLMKDSIKSTPISSQVFQEWKEGSETRVYDPGRVMKLHERLGKIHIF
uniref:Putative HNH endonuclease n=1 Tax=uncultured Trebouxia TaxID=1229085 RepID=A0A0S0N4M6_9CHLO|nr:putative HNH endonuclease [uncultured Trebouxia]ALH06414.1 putative HNH endonuclease [uncultured Trebouxia]ALH06416.1 putative HNH endonuclease [uncultured Trebouxia]ALH06418.1 putative HNH endonuclease [uncultured Trebouxia]ALH06420.1 putative HNH endonuclease [uncultured Trebouxia]